jgi:DNA-binding GntR family transcriptional regulator
VTQDLPPKPISPGRSIRSTNQAVADQAIELLIENIRKGKLVAGSRVTESALARMLHTTRNQTRDALRALASAGLLDFHSSRGILVPSPTRSDVLEIYVARRALGSEIVRRCCQTTPHQIEEIAKTISQLKEIAKTKDAYLTGEADLAFQNALANASGLRTIPQMFTLLTNQLRIYIAILGFRYAYSVDEMVDDDSELFEVIATRNQAAAVTKWQKKMSAAYEYMASEVR